MSDIVPRITFRNMDHSALLEENVLKNLEKIMKYLESEPTPIHVDVVFDNNSLHPTSRVELLIKSPNYDLMAHAEGPDMYQLIDQVIHKIDAELRREKKRIKNPIHNKSHHRP